MSKSDSMSAGEWMKTNGHTWSGKRPKSPKKARDFSSRAVRQKRGRSIGKKANLPIRAFVEKNRGHTGHACLFVPAAQKDVPSSLEFCGTHISAARYMLLLTQGTPNSEGQVARHLCGNGHLSCVNPNHLAWGSPGDNVADANKHRKAGDDVQDRIHAI